MKKLIVIALILLFAKVSPAAEFHPGLRLNPSVNWLSTQVLADNAPYSIKNNGIRFGYTIGAMADYMIKDNFGLTFELRFNNFTGKYEYTSMSGVTTNTYSIKQKFQYVEIPVGLKMRTNEIGYFHYYGVIGGMPAIKTGSEAIGTLKSEVSGKQVGNIESFNNRNAASIFAFYATLGGGIEYTLAGSTALVAGLTYHYGLTDITNGKDVITKDDLLQRNFHLPSDNYNIKPRYLTLDIGIKF